MPLILQNTRTRQTERIEPMDGATFRFYCCGPTVYGPAHIGNLRTFVVQDVFRRVLEFMGTPTCHVRNITDVDDKTIRESQAAGLPLEAFTAKWRTRFEGDCERLSCLPPHVAPSAVAHIDEQIRLIETLIEKGHAYRVEGGSVYYRIESFPGYGKLSGLNLSGNQRNASARLTDNDEYDKESWQDFALWKAWKPEDGPNRWDSPWGPGRPGWHIECSAMSMRYLGESFDLHSGGVDLIFPHHENEIAQSEAATGQPFARHWLHVAHLRVEGAKMSKSLGNLHTLDDVVARGFSPEALRYLLLSGHYRQPLNFTWASLAAAEKNLRRIANYTQGVELGPVEAAGFESLETTTFAPFFEALCDDLNTPKALGALHSQLKQIAAEDVECSAVRRDLVRILKMLGLPSSAPEFKVEQAPDEVQALAQRRDAARHSKQWAEADALREQLREQGWEVRDGADGYELRPLQSADAGAD